jgi:hypothetical protein
MPSIATMNAIFTPSSSFATIRLLRLVVDLGYPRFRG